VTACADDARAQRLPRRRRRAHALREAAGADPDLSRGINELPGARSAVDAAVVLHSSKAEVDLMRSIRWITAALVLAVVVPAPSTFAKATWVKKAQAEDPGIKTCTSCHTSMKSKDLNGRGQFLMDKKKELKAAEIDFKWLKDYKEPAK
jgi:hypothetical protein